MGSQIFANDGQNFDIRRGDTGTFGFSVNWGTSPSQLPMQVFMSIFDEETAEPIIPEMMTELVPSETGNVQFNLNASMSDQLIVPPGEESVFYGYALKSCQLGGETTISPALAERYGRIRVRRKLVEGITNE